MTASLGKFGELNQGRRVLRWVILCEKTKHNQKSRNVAFLHVELLRSLSLGVDWMCAACNFTGWRYSIHS